MRRQLGYDGPMARKLTSDPTRLREEIAHAAARLIAEEGLDFAGAKRKAARQLLGESRLSGDWLPDNELIEEAVREYQSIFQSDSQPAILSALRQVALHWMQRLAEFHPLLTGAVMNGTASEHSDVQLQLFCDSTKDVAIFLLNEEIQYEVSESPHFGGRDDVETLSFLTRAPAPVGRAGIHLALYDNTDMRGALRADERGRPLRINAAALTELMAHSEPPVHRP